MFERLNIVHVLVVTVTRHVTRVLVLQIAAVRKLVPNTLTFSYIIQYSYSTVLTDYSDLCNIMETW